MNKKVIFTVVPALLVAGILTSCGGDPTPTKEITNLEVSLSDASKVFYYGSIITKSDLKVIVTYSDGSISDPLKDDEYTVKYYDDSKKEQVELLSYYTFEEGDVVIGAKEFYITYSTKTVTFPVNVATDEDKFLNTYKGYSENFQSSGSDYIYDLYDLNIKLNDEELTPISLNYTEKSESVEVRECSVILDGHTKEPQVLAGGDQFTYYDEDSKGIKAYIQTLKDDGCDVSYEVSSEENTCTLKFAINPETHKGYTGSYTFNKLGYIIKGTEGSKRTIDVDYMVNEPHKAYTKDDFLKVYSTASKRFQDSNYGFDKYDLEVIDSVESKSITVSKVTYDTKESNRYMELTLNNSGELTVLTAGGDYTYFDDESKGIKSILKKLEDAAKAEQPTITSLTYHCNANTGKSSYSYIEDNNKKTFSFDKNGYLTEGYEKTGGYTITYGCDPHNSHSLECKYSESLYTGTLTSTQENPIALNDLVSVTVSYNNINAFNTVKWSCVTPKDIINVDSNIKVCGVYDNKSTAIESYTVTDNIITFNEEIKDSITIDLKVKNSAGISSITVEAYLATAE